MSAVAVAALTIALVLLMWPPRVDVPGMPLWRGSTWRRGSRAVHRAAELEWLEAMVAELRAGADAHSALLASATSVGHGVVPGAVTAVRSGSDVAAALAASPSGSELMRGAAACWAVAEGSGAGLAAALTTLADAARATERVRRELHAGLAEPRATALVLAGLPLLGIALGTALGADPLAWLFGSPAGLAVLALGGAFEVLGAWWAWRIAMSLEAEL